jgi:hypothetical protein
MSTTRLFGISIGLSALLATFACGSSVEDDSASTGGAGAQQDLRSVEHCGGIAGLKCSGTLTCVDDPIDSCDPANGGKDCSGICVDVSKAQQCGGIAAIQCADGAQCVDNPNDHCDPSHGADCSGICVKAACDPKLALTATCKPGTHWEQAKCACVAAKASCADLKCGAGYHCEEKGINGGTVPACLKDDNTDCRTTGCDAAHACQACWGAFACVPKGAFC